MNNIIDFTSFFSKMFLFVLLYTGVFWPSPYGRWNYCYTQYRSRGTWANSFARRHFHQCCHSYSFLRCQSYCFYRVSKYISRKKNHVQFHEKNHFQFYEKKFLSISRKKITFDFTNFYFIFSYIKTLEWILIYSTVPIKFHIITNEDSVKYVDKIMEKINMTSNCDFTHTIMTLSHIIDVTNKEICPKLGTRTEFCEVLMGTMTPLLFPYLFLNLDHVVYVDRSLGKNHA